MVLVSMNVPKEYIDRKKKTGVKWAWLIYKGLEMCEVGSTVSKQLRELEELREKQKRTAELLQKYADICHNNNFEIE